MGSFQAFTRKQAAQGGDRRLDQGIQDLRRVCEAVQRRTMRACPQPNWEENPKIEARNSKQMEKLFSFRISSFSLRTARLG